MSGGCIIVARRDIQAQNALVRALRRHSSDVRKVVSARCCDVMLLHSSMRAEAIVIDADPDRSEEINLLRALNEDIYCPHVVVCTDAPDGLALRRLQRLCSCEVIADSEDISALSKRIEHALVRRRIRSSGGLYTSRVVNRILSEQGLTCHLHGYQYLMRAMELVGCGDCRACGLHELCCRIAHQTGGRSASVEHDLRYAISQCEHRAARSTGDPMDFLRSLANEAFGMAAKDGDKMRLSVFGRDGRIFE